MKPSTATAASTSRKPIPRGIATAGPPILSYGFRPFFLLAGVVAVFDMIAWVGALSGFWPVGGAGGPIAWHAHEMLFGYTAAAVCGFVLTAVPNWTGGLPVSGAPLLVLVLIWLAGRLCVAFPWLLGEPISALIDCLFLPALAFVVAREVVVGKNWQNLRVAGAIAFLALLNGGFHLADLLGWDSGISLRLAVSTYVMLISQVGGRIVPSFTRNYLAKRSMPTPRTMPWLDNGALLATLVCLVIWAVLPDWWGVLPLGLAASGLQTVRLAGWRGWSTFGEPLLAVLHVGYAFVPLGLVGVAMAAIGLLATASALHILTVGAIGLMTVAVMTRATRGHTGRPLTASAATTTVYTCLFLAALARPAAEVIPEAYHALLAISGTAWILAFVVFVVEHGPMLLSRSARPAKG